MRPPFVGSCGMVRTAYAGIHIECRLFFLVLLTHLIHHTILVAFYGNKLFQSSFLLALTGNDTSLFYFSLAASVNSAVAFAGYLSAAIIIDKVGRASLQMFGLFLTGSLFVACSFLFDYLDSIALVAIYLCSSFFGQMGPNATTFLIPAEIFPTQMRTFCHGVSAASGKLGALVAAISFNYLSAMDMFLFAGYASFAACVITLWGIPETSGLDLYEIDRKWRLIIEGRKRDYEGDADNPKYLSYHERHIRVLRCCQDLDNLDHNDL